MPIELFRPAAPAAPAAPQTLPQVAQASVGAERSKMLAEMLQKMSLEQQRLPGSNLEGFSRVVGAGLSGYHGAQAHNQELAQRQALIEALGGEADISPLEKTLMVSGDAAARNSVLQARVARAAQIASQTWQEKQQAAQHAFTAGEGEKSRANALAVAETNAKAREEMQAERIKAAEERIRLTAELKKPPEGKPLNRVVENDLRKAGESLHKTHDMIKQFDDSMAGYTGGGETAVAIGRTALGGLFVGEEGRKASTWWTDYQERRNEIRKSLFGSALTAHEQAEWEKADINPNMPPEQIRYHLARQAVAVQRAVMIHARSQAVAGGHVGQIGVNTGLTEQQIREDALPDYPEISAPPAGAAPPAAPPPGAAPAAPPAAAAPPATSPPAAAAPPAAPPPPPTPPAPLPEIRSRSGQVMRPETAPQATPEIRSRSGQVMNPGTAAPAPAAPAAPAPGLEGMPPNVQAALQAGKTIKSPDGRKLRIVNGAVTEVQ